MVELNDALCAIPVDLRAIVLSNIEHVQTRQILASSSTFREAFSLAGALPRTFDYEGVAGDDIADHLVHVLDRVRSLGNERALELMGDEKDRLCEYACGRNFEVLKWARNELNLPWATTSGTGESHPTRGPPPALYPAEPVSDDVLVLYVLRETWPQLRHWGEYDGWWEVNVRPEWRRGGDGWWGWQGWHGVGIENGRVVVLNLDCAEVTGAVPAEVGRLSALRILSICGYWEFDNNPLTSLPAEIGQLASLTELRLYNNQLTILPAEIGQLTSLEWLHLDGNQLTSVPAEIGQLTSLRQLILDCNKLRSVPAALCDLRVAGCDVWLDDSVMFHE